MKKFLLFIYVLFLFGNVKGQTNVYHPFPLNSAKWRFDYFDNSCSGYCYTYTDIMSGNITIGSFTYKIFGSNGDAIRQDIAMKKVYYYDNGNHTEYLLYDFNLSVGDTIPHTWYGNLGTDIVTVQSIDSISVNGQFRNRYTLHNHTHSYNPVIIEGVGNTAGAISPFQPCICEVDLVCFQGDGILELSYFSPYSNCNDLVDIDEYAIIENITLSPNPATNELTLESKNLKIKSINILNVIGCEILSFDKLRMTGSETIDVSSFVKGIYFIEVRTETGIVRKKFVKQ